VFNCLTERWSIYRDELINVEIFVALAEAQILIKEWQKDYNQVRTPGSLRYRPPVPEAIMMKIFN